ncbi:recombinase family protein [Enterococcus asini]|uniref:recombinase family protein n=1 Tax=Enterococcus asini TaxID=57732 RepID=UPI0022E36B6E|nr:recombinase family protein [Enterococcus asini]
MKRVALYIRVSSDEQAKFGDSIREQQETLTEYVERHDDMKIVSTYIDDGISGQKLNRDEFAQLITDVKGDQIDLIIFTKLDRWFRSLKHYLNTQDILEAHNVYWFAVSQPYYDTRTAQGRAFIAQSMTWAELEAQQTSERTIAINISKVKNGEAITGSTPFGYSIKDKHLFPDDNAPIALAIFEYFDQTSSIAGTVKYLKETFGISRTRPGIRNMLKNRMYIGKYRQNNNYCPAIIPETLFDSVQRKLPLNVKSNNKNDYIFQGLMVCNCCGRKMSAGQATRYGRPRKDGTKKHYPSVSVYKCRYHISDKRDCPNKKTIKETVLEEYLLDHIKEMIQFEIVAIENKKKQVIDTKARRRKIEEKLDRLKAAYLDDVIGLDEYKKDRQELQETLATFKQKPSADISNKKSDLEELLYSGLFDHYPVLTKLEKKEFWRSFIDSITMDGDRNISVKFLESTYVLTDTDGRASFRR